MSESQSKTVKEWLSELEEPQRSQALANMETYCTMAGDLPAKSLYLALSSAFVWSQAPEGYEYWSSFCFTLSKKTPNV